MRSANVVALVVRRGMGLTAVGVALGTGLALVTTQVLESILFEITPSDPIAYVAVTAVLLFAALVAGALPAVRPRGRTH